jgi:two-component system cell cycle response regulator
MSPTFNEDDTLTRRRREAERFSPPRPFRAVLIDDDPAILRLVGLVLRSRGIETLACGTGGEGWAVLEQEEWDVCILDRGLPDLDGLEICRRIKETPRFDTRQVIVLSAYASLDQRVEALELGADDYITKPFHPAELLARVQAARRVVELQNQLVEMARQLEELSSRDELTGVFNRRHFSETLEKAFDRWQRYRRPLSIAMIDVDRFKQVNDTFGHQKGDAVLTEVARRFAKAMRSSDYLARLGGEEFAVLLPETQLSDALTFSEKMRSAIAAAPVQVGGGEALSVTVSVGTASLAHTDFHSVEEMITAADEALYRAKHNGRNRVEAERRRVRRDATPAVARV